MAGYQSRRGPNVSQFIASLNTMPAFDDKAQDDFGIDEDDLKLFMHTEFLVEDPWDDTLDQDEDYNNQQILGGAGSSGLASAPERPSKKRARLDGEGEEGNSQPQLHPSLDPRKNPLNPTSPADFAGPGRQPQQSDKATNPLPNLTSHQFDTAADLLPGGGAGNGDIKSFDFDDDFQLHGLPYIPSGNASTSYQNYGSANQQEFDLSFPSPTSPYGPLHNAGSPVTPSPPNGLLPSPPNGVAPSPPNGMLPTPPNGPGARIAATDQVALEANSRAAADEDKRRRNTAASARFRVKKKQREQALEKTAKEMSDKCEQLEQKVSQLEMENKWLRGLVVEKTTKSGEEVAELWRKFKEDDRINESEKKGVGTPEA